MQAAILMGTYILTALVVQFIGFVISQAVEVQWPAAGLLTFLILFMAAYGIAWPIAVRIAEWGLVRFGYEIEQTDARAR